MSYRILSIGISVMCTMIVWYLSAWVYSAETIEVPTFTTTPEQFLDTIVDKVNKWSENITQSHLDQINSNEWDYDSQYQVTNTLDALRKRLVPYIQWIVFLWLSWAVFAIIYLWSQLVWASLSWKDEMVSQVKNTLTNVVVWVLWLTGFYFIMKLLLSIVANFTN